MRTSACLRVPQKPDCHEFIKPGCSNYLHNKFEETPKKSATKRKQNATRKNSLFCRTSINTASNFKPASSRSLPKCCESRKKGAEMIKPNVKDRVFDMGTLAVSRSYDQLIKNQDTKSKPYVPFLKPYQARFQRSAPTNKKLSTTECNACNIKLLQPERRKLIAAVQKCTHLKKRAGTFLKMNTEDNGNVGLLKPTSSSNEDLSEYTDADESISAPTEFLAEFLSAVMLKDYETALKYCKLILQYEPNNITAKEFYPLIIEKLQQSVNNDEASSNDSEDEENDNSSSSNSSDSESSSSSNSNSDDSSEEQEDEEGIEIGQGVDKRSKGSSDGDATTGSYSSLEDDEAETDQLAALAAKYQTDNVNLGNGNKIYVTNLAKTFDNKLSNAGSIANQMPFGTSSDSESPTEPVSQQTVAMLRAKVVPTKI